MTRDDPDPNPPRIEQTATAAQEPTTVLPETPPAASSEAASPAPAPTAQAAPWAPSAEPTRRRSPSRGWVIAGAGVGGVLLLGLAFGGGVATGFALDAGRSGPAAESGGHGLPGGGHGREDGDGRGPATPPHGHEGDSEDSSAPDS